MNDNSFRITGDVNTLKEFILSSIEASNEVIEHYDFVLKDISSKITDEALEKTKAPTVEFLKRMRGNWISFRNDLESELNQLK